ncbi:MAG: hypothetical protein COT00_03505 [Candidatus Omnitrophica bacterium CG07_land_8_20_14_0_80_50_8]|nr:MAG: hypothetical protein COT00_03505 [Candidatus Omnitrophica bacterium CG07_land_8_20_14_0_80_50_8]
MLDDKHASFNVLFIEDNIEYANVLKRRLLEATHPVFHIEHVHDLRQGFDCLSAGKTDIILLDLTLPDSKGLDTLIQVRAYAPEIPVVISTALDDEITGIEAVRQGADDYLVKGRIDR